MRISYPNLLVLFSCIIFKLGAFTSTVKFSDDFYGAQKYFYNEAKKKFPKIAMDKFYPEIPIRGTASSSDLKNIAPSSDFFEARRKITDEAAKYPEQIYTEVFAFLTSHPGINENPGNKAKFEAIENYFFPYIYLFSADRNYAINPEVRLNPCPLVFCMKDEKKNTISFKIFNSSKKNFSFNLNETQTQNYFTLSGKKPINVKAGQSATVKLTINLQQLKKDSSFKLFQFIFSDPAQPRVKLIMPIVLLPSKDMLAMPPHFYDFRFVYSTFFKNIDMYKDRTSGPVNCVNGNCSGEKSYSLRSHDRAMISYDYGDLCALQYNITTFADAGFNAKNSHINFIYNELGSIEGRERDCPGLVPNSSVPCPTDAGNNGKQLYGKRKIESKLYLPPGKIYTLKSTLRYSDLANQLTNSEISWLQEKKLVINIVDENKKEVARGVVSGTQFNFDKPGIPAGNYTVSIYTATENESSYPAGFEINHLNHANRSRFDFILNASFAVQSTPLPVMTKK